MDKGIGRNGKVELPFALTFPDEVRMAPDNMYKRRPGLEDEEGHPLPTYLDYGMGHNIRTKENKGERIPVAVDAVCATCGDQSEVFRLLSPRAHNIQH